jgi:hypothetical protein
MQDLKDAQQAGAKLSQEKILGLMPFEVNYEENQAALEREMMSGFSIIDPAIEHDNA